MIDIKDIIPNSPDFYKMSYKGECKVIVEDKVYKWALPIYPNVTPVRPFKYKISMSNTVVDQEDRVFEYTWENKKPIFKYIFSIVH